jgi:hypothetical protein
MTECRFGRSELFYIGERVAMAQTRNDFIAAEKDMKEFPLEWRRATWMNLMAERVGFEPADVTQTLNLQELTSHGFG